MDNAAMKFRKKLEAVELWERCCAQQDAIARLIASALVAGELTDGCVVRAYALAYTKACHDERFAFALSLLPDVVEHRNGHHHR
jgi:hypothetical protein